MEYWFKAAGQVKVGQAEALRAKLREMRTWGSIADGDREALKYLGVKGNDERAELGCSLEREWIVSDAKIDIAMLAHYCSPYVEWAMFSIEDDEDHNRWAVGVINGEVAHLTAHWCHTTTDAQVIALTPINFCD